MQYLGRNFWPSTPITEKKKKTSSQSLQLQTLINLEMKRSKPKVSSKDISEIKAETKVIENRKKKEKKNQRN